MRFRLNLMNSSWYYMLFIPLCLCVYVRLPLRDLHQGKQDRSLALTIAPAYSESQQSDCSAKLSKQYTESYRPMHGPLMYAPTCTRIYCQKFSMSGGESTCIYITTSIYTYPSQCGRTAERGTRDREVPGSKLACAIWFFSLGKEINLMDSGLKICAEQTS